jgi:hypothetical protein
MNKFSIILVIGDALAIAIVTLIGFAAHGQTGLALIPRMMTTFLPLLAGWFLLASLLNLFSSNITQNPRQLWRPIYAALLAAPLAGVLRAVILGGVVLPVFVLVLGANTALGMLLWRTAFLFIQRRLSLIQ